MKIGFYAGSFDPFTIGHLHIAKNASKLFDKLIVGIGVNPAKTRRFDKEKMKQAIENTLESENISNAQVVIYEGYTVHKASEMGATFLVRGLRDAKDYAAEEELAKANKGLSGMETVYLRTGDYDYVSSSLVFEKLKNGEDISKLVPPQILKAIEKEDI